MTSAFYNDIITVQQFLGVCVLYSVILVDDEHWTLESLKLMFPWKKYNFELIQCTTDGKEALNLISSLNPHLVISDISMPGYTGLDLMHFVANRKLRSKFIIVSAHDNFEYAKEAVHCDAIEYLLKPLSEEDAENALKKAKDFFDNSYHTTISRKETNFGISNRAFSNMIDYINNNYMERLTLSSVTSLFNINSSYCCQLFKKYYDCSFSDYINNLKLIKAKDLLLQGKSVRDTADYLNYDYSYFNKLFKKQFGCTPYTFLKK